MKNILVVLLLFWPCLTVAGQQPTQVSLQLQWKHQFEFAGFYAAQEQGFYQEVGLDVEFIEYEEGMDQVAEVLAGGKTFGLWGAGLIGSLVQEKPVVFLANYLKQSPLVIITKSTIYTPADLRGKRLMISDVNLHSAAFLHMFHNFNIEPEEIIAVPPSFTIDSFINNDVDAYLAFSTNEPFILQNKGIPYNILNPSHYGTEMYDLNLFTSREITKQNPVLVRHFVQASNRGWRYALAHQEELVGLILAKYNSQKKSRESLLFEAREIAQIMNPDVYPIGSIDMEKVSKMAVLFSQHGLPDTLKSYDEFVFELVDLPDIGLTSAETAFLANHPVIRVDSQQSLAPLSFVKGGEPLGYSVDLLKLLAEKLGIEVDFIGGSSFQEFLLLLQNKEIDLLSSLIKTKDRSSLFLFTSPSVELSPVIVSRDNLAHKSLEELRGRTVTIVKGFWYGEALAKYYPDIDILVKETLPEAVKAVSIGEADATIGVGSVLQYLWLEQGLSNLLISGQADIPGAVDHYHRMGVRRDWPLLQSALNKALQAMTYDEERALKEKWFGGEAKIDCAHFNLTEEEQVYLEQKKTITMCVDPDWMPFEKINDGGQYIGMAADILDLVQGRSGIELEVVKTESWSESLEFAKARKCDLFSLAMETPERKEYMDFTAPYISFPFVVATRIDKRFVERFEDILDKPLVMVKGYAYVEILRNRYPALNLLEVETMLDGLKMVQNEEVYGFIGALATVAYTIQKEGMVDVKIAGKFADNWQLAIGTRNDEPILKNIMQKALETVSEKEKRDIYNSWFAIRFEQGVDYRLVWEILLTGLIMAIIVVFYLRSMRKYAVRLREANALLEDRNDALHKALAEVKELQGIIPICASCKKIRADTGYWQQVEHYISEHSDAKFSHGYCPDCYEQEMAKIEEWKSTL